MSNHWTMDLSQTKVYEAIYNGDTVTVASALRPLIKSRRNLHLTDGHDRGYLHHMIVEAGKFKNRRALAAVYELCGADVDINARDHDGNTPLHLLATKDCPGSYRILVALMRCGADVTLKNKQGQTVLDILTENKEKQPGLLDWYKRYEPGLLLACKAGDLARVEILLKSWCRTIITINGKSTKIEDIVQNIPFIENREKTIALLQQFGDTNEFVMATLAADVDRMIYLMKTARCDVNTRDHQYQYKTNPQVPLPLLAVAWEQDNLSLVDALMQFHPDTSYVYTNIKEEHPMPLFFQVLCGQPGTNKTEIVYRVIKGADLTRTNHKGQTILFEAIREGMSESFIFTLLKQGVDIASRDYKGRTARQFAEENLQDEYADLIDNYVRHLIKENCIAELERMTYKDYDRIETVLTLNIEEAQNLSRQIHSRREYREMNKFVQKLPFIKAMSQTLFEACETSRLTLIKELIDRDSRLMSCQNFCGQTLFHRALLLNNDYLLEYFCTHHQKHINTPDNLLRSPLHYAVCLYGKNSSVCELLLDADASPHVKDALGRKPEEYDKSHHDTYSYEMLRQEISSFYARVYVHDSELDYRLKSAIGSGRLHEVQEVVSEAKLNSVNIRDLSGVLFDCLDTNNPSAAILLLENGADPNIWTKSEDCDSHDPLCKSRRCGHAIVSLKERATELGYKPLVQFIENTLSKTSDSTDPYMEKLNPFRSMVNFGSL